MNNAEQMLSRVRGKYEKKHVWKPSREFVRGQPFVLNHVQSRSWHLVSLSFHLSFFKYERLINSITIVPVTLHRGRQLVGHVKHAISVTPEISPVNKKITNNSTQLGHSIKINIIELAKFPTRPKRWPHLAGLKSTQKITNSGTSERMKIY